MSLIGRGGTAALPGTTSTSGLTNSSIIADFRDPLDTGVVPPDGSPVNCVTVTNNDLTTSYVAWISINGDTAGPVQPGQTLSFQRGFHTNGIKLVRGWLATLAGGTTSASSTVSLVITSIRD